MSRRPADTPPEDLLSIRLQLMVTRDEAKQLDEARQETSRSEFIRTALIKALRRASRKPVAKP